MRKKTPITEIKKKAKEQLLGNYSIAIKSFVLLFVIMYLLMSLTSGGIMRMVFGNISGSHGINPDQLDAILSNQRNSIMITILYYIVMAVVSPIISLFSVGYMYVIKCIYEGKKVNSSGLFYPFKNHPDKIIIISLIVYVVQILVTLPSSIYDQIYLSNYPVDEVSGRNFLIFTILLLLGLFVGFVFMCALSQCYLVYLDDPEEGAINCIKESIKMMKGNKWRYFYLLLSFIGYMLLSMLSLGIALLWISPYQNMAMIAFYDDIKKTPTIELCA